ncbi:MAG: adenylosuccinate synthase [Myxococcota bacterium]
MPAVVVVGAQWGDEGKGKVVDLLAPYADMVVRYAGGANAGHTLVVNGEKVVLHLVPSGALHPGTSCLIGQGTVIDPEVLCTELDVLAARGFEPSRFLVSDRAHVVLPHHKVLDALRESTKGDRAIGTTRRGIGPCYQDKFARRGIRMGDLIRPDRFRSRIYSNLDSWKPVLSGFGSELPDVETVIDAYLKLGERLKPHFVDAQEVLANALDAEKKVLAEGAQGTMLDVDHGTYPFVTSSNAIAGGACTGAGLPPTRIRRVIGITKAYTTRVGGGPFPTELTGSAADYLQSQGAEFGATTGRPRRCGWLDGVALRFACRVNGLTELALTKLDVLSGLPKLHICTQYVLDGEPLSRPPFDGLDRVVAQYEEFEGWDEDLSNCKTLQSLPASARRYIARIEELAGCEVGTVSVGPDRKRTLALSDPFR